MGTVVRETDIPHLKRFATGKVRDVYDLGNALLIVATDRVSAFDSVMPTGIPDKGRVLTQLSRFWFLHVSPFLANHYITVDDAFIATRLEELHVNVTPELREMLAGRAMLALKAQALPVECVVRGYLAGSLWSEYRRAGGEDKAVTLHGIDLPAGLRESEQLAHPIFTPATKAETGHDENIGMAELREIVGEERAEQLAEASISVYRHAADYARQRGVIIADTKFEFGLFNGTLVLIDEVLTPDSSRFWDASKYQAGRAQDSFDKQYLRDWLVASGWNKEPPAPELPPDVVKRTAEKYREAFRRITGSALS